MGMFIIILFVALAGFAIWLNYWFEKKRREAMAALAASLGLRFSPEKDHAIQHFMFLDKLAQGENRYAYNVISGAYRGHEVLVFDYHYETHSTDSKGRRQTHHHYFSFFILFLPKPFPELTIAPEGILSKIAQAFGYDDIDFESAEFSRKFVVRSKDKKFAYDVCHARMMEYMLANTDLNLEIESTALAMAFASRLSMEQIKPNLERLVAIRELMPAYLVG